MKFRSNGNYYIPNLESKFGGVREYRFKDDEEILKLILQDTCDCVSDLLSQYPDAFLPEVMFEFLDKAYKQARLLGVNPECCYSYFAKCCLGNFHGVRIQPLDYDSYDHLFSLDVTTNTGNIYQRRVGILYDIEDDSFIPNRIVEVQNNQGIVIQKNFSPKVLRRSKRYVNY
jgi:hypothetical protein